MLRVEAVERAAQVGRRGDLGHRIGGVEVFLVVDIRADAAEVHAAVHGMARIGEDRRSEPQLGFRRGVNARCRFRRRILGGIEAVGIDAAQMRHGIPGALAGLAVGKPQRHGVAVLHIERVDGIAFVLARRDALKLLPGDQLTHLVGDFGIGGGEARRCGACGRLADGRGGNGRRRHWCRRGHRDRLCRRPDGRRHDRRRCWRRRHGRSGWRSNRLLVHDSLRGRDHAHRGVDRLGGSCGRRRRDNPRVGLLRLIVLPRRHRSGAGGRSAGEDAQTDVTHRTNSTVSDQCSCS